MGNPQGRERIWHCRCAEVGGADKEQGEEAKAAASASLVQQMQQDLTKTNSVN